MYSCGGVCSCLVTCTYVSVLCLSILVRFLNPEYWKPLGIFINFPFHSNVDLFVSSNFKWQTYRLWTLDALLQLKFTLQIESWFCWRIAVSAIKFNKVLWTILSNMQYNQVMSTKGFQLNLLWVCWFFWVLVYLCLELILKISHSQCVAFNVNVRHLLGQIELTTNLRNHKFKWTTTKIKRLQTTATTNKVVCDNIASYCVLQCLLHCHFTELTETKSDSVFLYSVYQIVCQTQHRY